MNKLSYDFSVFCIKTLNLNKNSDVLDIGGRYPTNIHTPNKYQGSFSYHFRHLFHSTIAIDVKDDGQNVDLVLDAEDLLWHFPPKTFNAIVCQSTIENFNKKLAHQTPNIMSTLLKDNGSIIMAGETPDYYIKYNYPKTDRRYRRHQYTQKEIVCLFKEYKLIFPKRYNRYNGFWQCYGYKNICFKK